MTQKTTTIEIKNPAYRESQPAALYTPTQDDYFCVRTIREKYAVDDKELYGQLLRGILQAEKTDSTEMFENFIEQVKEVNRKLKLTDHNQIKGAVKTTSITFRNTNHPDVNVKEDNPVEELWFNAAKEVRKIVGPGTSTLIIMFASALVESERNENWSKLNEFKEDIVKRTSEYQE